jgi:hypothetical protein
MLKPELIGNLSVEVVTVEVAVKLPPPPSLPTVLQRYNVKSDVRLQGDFKGDFRGGGLRGKTSRRTVVAGS